MMRTTASRFCAAGGSSCSACPCFAQLEKNKMQIGGAVATVLVGAWMYSGVKARSQAELDHNRNTRLQLAEDALKTSAATVKKLQQDLKVSQTAILGQETTLRQLSDALISLEKRTAERTAELAAAIDATGSSTSALGKMTEAELLQHRQRLAELYASRAKTEARFQAFEQQVQRCREPVVPPTVMPAVEVAAAESQTETPSQ